MASGDEVHYCGNCRRQYSTGVEKRPGCGKQTVIWFDNRESEGTAIKLWKTINGEPV